MANKFQILNDAPRPVPFINPNEPISSRRQCWSPDFRYAGNLSVTKTGRGCQNWNVSYPHVPKFQPVDLGIGHNFCRNPDGDNSGPWCYSIDPEVRIDLSVQGQVTKKLATIISLNMAQAQRSFATKYLKKLFLTRSFAQFD